MQLELPCYLDMPDAVRERFARIDARPVVLEVKNVEKRFRDPQGRDVLALRDVSFTVHRREFIAARGGAMALPLAAHAQQAAQMRRVGVLMHATADDPEAQARLTAFLQGLQEAGWSVGRNVHIDTRWSPADQMRLAKNRSLAGWRARKIALSRPVLQGLVQMIPGIH